MTGQAEGTPGYLDLPSGYLFTVLHEPVGPVQGSAVLLCPPFGWEDAMSYRARRAWAVELASAGHPVLRFDLPGTGESHHLTAGDAIPTWTAAVAAAARVLAERAETVTALGLGLGGLLAALAKAEGAPVEDLVLWATPGRGRSLLRELRAFALLQSHGDEGGEPGDLWVNGYRLSSATVASLQALDLRELGLHSGRALLLGRDRLPADPALVEATAALDSSTGSGEGWAELHDVQDPVLPVAVTEVVAGWLRRGTGTKGPWAGSATASSAGARLECLDLDGMAAVVTHPPAGRRPGCVVYLNAGGTRRSGPSSLWVPSAEAAAANGSTSVRLDLEGIGDSAGAPTWSGGAAAFYTPVQVSQVRGALDRLGEVDLPPPYTLVGLCSGAYWSFCVGQEDDRVDTVVLLNPQALVWSDGITDLRTSQHASRLLRWSTWRRILRGQASSAHAREVVGALWRRGRRALRRSADTDAPESAIREGFTRLRARGVATHLAFSLGEPLARELEPMIASLLADGVEVHELGGPTGAHTLGPPVLRQASLDLLTKIITARDDRVQQ